MTQQHLADAPASVTHVENLISELLDESGQRLYQRWNARSKPFLNSQEARNLAEWRMLDDVDIPRPLPTLRSNLSTATLHTYHRARVSSSPARRLAGGWTPRLATIPIDSRVARILLERFRGEMSLPTKENLQRVVDGQTSRQQKTKKQYAGTGEPHAQPLSPLSPAVR